VVDGKGDALLLLLLDASPALISRSQLPACVCLQAGVLQGWIKQAGDRKTTQSRRLHTRCGGRADWPGVRRTLFSRRKCDVTSVLFLRSPPASNQGTSGGVAVRSDLIADN